jgi:hypothetical protein
MKKSILLLLTLGIIAGGCQKFDPTDIWDNIHSLDERVGTLENCGTSPRQSASGSLYVAMVAWRRVKRF